MANSPWRFQVQLVMYDIEMIECGFQWQKKIHYLLSYRPVDCPNG